MKKYIITLYMMNSIYHCSYPMMREDELLEREKLYNKKDVHDDSDQCCGYWGQWCKELIRSSLKMCLCRTIIATACALQKCCGK